MYFRYLLGGGSGGKFPANEHLHQCVQQRNWVKLLQMTDISLFVKGAAGDVAAGAEETDRWREVEA